MINYGFFTSSNGVERTLDENFVSLSFIGKERYFDSTNRLEVKHRTGEVLVMAPVSPHAIVHVEAYVRKNNSEGVFVVRIYGLDQFNQTDRERMKFRQEAAAITLDVFRFAAPEVNTEKYGMNIYNSTGVCTFSSNQKYMNPVSILHTKDGNDSNEITVPHNKRYGVILCPSPKFYNPQPWREYCFLATFFNGNKMSLKPMVSEQLDTNLDSVGVFGFVLPVVDITGY